MFQKFFRDVATDKAAPTGHKNFCHNDPFVDKLSYD
jgi:hypothetical protein